MDSRIICQTYGCVGYAGVGNPVACMAGPNSGLRPYPTCPPHWEAKAV
jgi:hypothetical protein